MKKNLKCFSVLLALLLIAQFVLPVTAHEYSTQRYFGNLSMQNGYPAQVNYVYHYETTVSDSRYRALLIDSIDAWENSCSGFYAYGVISTLNANVMFHDTWPSNYPDDWFGACTSRTSNATLWNWGTNWSAPIGTKSVHRIDSASIYVNLDFQDYYNFSDSNIMHTYLHEIGHFIGFYETNDGTASVMKQGNLTYTSPTYHDERDFISKYSWVSW